MALFLPLESLPAAPPTFSVSANRVLSALDTCEQRWTPMLRALHSRPSRQLQALGSNLSQGWPAQSSATGAGDGSRVSVEGRKEGALVVGGPVGDPVGDPVGEPVAICDGNSDTGKELKLLNIGPEDGVAVACSTSSSALATEITASNKHAKRVRSFMVTTDHLSNFQFSLSKFWITNLQFVTYESVLKQPVTTHGRTKENSPTSLNAIMCESYGFGFLLF